MPFRLQRKFGHKLMLVHLVREPTAVCWSVLKQKTHRAKRAGRRVPHYALRCSWVILGWWVANLSCELFGLLYPHHYVRLRYEDFAHSPAEALRMLFEKLLPVTGGCSDGAGARDNRHQLFGNRLRSRHISIDDVKEDLKWKSEMPLEYHKPIIYLSYLLRLRYGYS